MRATWWSQPYPPEGTMASDGIQRQLGTPSLDPLAVLIRETAQNSWDARSDDSGGVALRYELFELKQAAAAAELLLPGPAVPDQPDRLGPSITPGSRVLLVSDRGTDGLGGPLRSDVPAESGEMPDFVNFIRNVGEARDRALGGGTYGFGKGILYRVSGPSTIIVDTTCLVGGGLQRRLMGAALTHGFTRSGRRYTGRHWWGVERDGIIDPLLDDEAATTADSLGLRGFASGETGTDIYVLDPDLGTEADGTIRCVSDAARYMAGSAVWFLWPKLLERDGRRPMTVEVSLDGKEIPIPEPEKARRLRPFVRAFRALDAPKAKPLTRRSPPNTVGVFASAESPYAPTPDGVLDSAEPFAGPAHHCAQMRDVELVVNYVAGPDHPDPQTQYGAVFRASVEADDHFAQAEPPTHDDWVTQHLSGTDRGVVTAARRFVRDEMARVATPAADAGPHSSSRVPLGELSSTLARILPTASGDGGSAGGGGGDTGGGSGGGGGPRRPITQSGPAQLAVVDGTARILQPCRAADSASDITAVAIARVAVDGSAERVAPLGAPMPEVLGWMSDTGDWVAGDVLTISPSATRDWVVHVKPAPHASTLVTVRPASEVGA